MQVSIDPLIIGILIIIFAFIIAVFLFLRRTLLAFREGMEQSDR